MELFTIYGVSAVALVMALTQIFKQYIPERFIPLLPLVLGILVVVISTWDIGATYILGGLVVGLAGMGVYDIDSQTTKIGETVAGFFK